MIEMLDQAERMYYRHPVPDVRPVNALKARVWLMLGDVEPQAWTNERDLSVDDDLIYMREFEHIMLARVLIARYKSDHDGTVFHNILGLLERLLEKAEAGNRLGSTIEILTLRALAYQAQGNMASALKPLKLALILAEPESYVQIFIDEGQPMLSLLQDVIKEDTSSPFAAQILATLQKDSGDAIVEGPLIVPLSERESEILKLIAAGLRNAEIADQMVISLNTVLYHTKNIYNKLGVNKRTQAVLKAQELNLL